MSQTSASAFAPGCFLSVSNARWHAAASCCNTSHADASCELYPVLTFAPARVAKMERCSKSKNAKLPTAFWRISVGTLSDVPTIGAIYAAVTSASARAISASSIWALSL